MPSNGCIGSSAGGALTELIALGAADAYLTQNPNITYWRFRYLKHTNFALEPIEQPMNTVTAFGSDSQITLNRTGDLIYFQYAIVDLPGIVACLTTSTGNCAGEQPSNEFPPSPAQCVNNCGTVENPIPFNWCDPCCDGIEPPPFPDCFPCPEIEPITPVICTGLDETCGWAHWVNAIGQYILRQACLVVGGQVIDTLYSDYLFFWEELSGKPGKRLQEMIGKRFTRAQLIEDSKRDRRLYVPLPWWFTMSSGNALALVSLQFHGVQVSLSLERLSKLVQRSDCDVAVFRGDCCTRLCANDVRVSIESTYVYLDIEERDRFATGSFEQLITQVQIFTMTGRHIMRLNLNFNHPMIELIFAVRRSCQTAVNNLCNYAGKFGRDPIKEVGLCLNNLARFTQREGRYFRLVQPYQYHTNIPDAFVYVYSFALFPEEPQPSGSANFSRIDNVELQIELQDEIKDEDVTCFVFGRNWNIFRYRDGLGGIAFSN